MATRAKQQVVEYYAWDTGTGTYKTGDSANHSLSWVKDGTRSAATNSCAEVDSSNCPGLYKVTLTSTECDCDIGTLHGKSSTTGVILIPVTIQFERLPDAAPNATGGVSIVGSAMTLAAEQRVKLDASQPDYAPAKASDLLGIRLVTTVSAVNSQTSFVLAAGASNNDAYNNNDVVLIKADGTQESTRYVNDYVGSTKTMLLQTAATYTVSVGDTVIILASRALKAVTDDGRALDINISNRVAANLRQALDVNLTEGGAGRLAAGIVKLFDVAVPTLTLSNGAKMGDKMDLVDSPNSTAITAVQSGLANAADQAAIKNIFSGMTSLPNWLRALFRKDAANTVAKNEINNSGGGYDEATDSMEAVRDRGDAAWTTATGFAVAGDIPSASDNAGAVRAELAAELAHLDADVSSRLAAANYTAPDNDGIGSAKTAAESVAVKLPTSDYLAGSANEDGSLTIPAPTVDTAAIADAVFDELLSGHQTDGSAGKALSDAAEAAGGATIVTPVVARPIERTRRSKDITLYVGEVVETLIQFEDSAGHAVDLSGYDSLTLTITAIQTATDYVVLNDSLNRTNDAEGLIGFTNAAEITDIAVTGTPDMQRPLAAYPLALRHTSSKAVVGTGKVFVNYAPGS